MASTTQDLLLKEFQGLMNAWEIDVIRAAVERAGAPINPSQTGGTSSAAGSAADTGGSVASTVAKVFTSGLGLVPLFSGLFGLFGGGGEPEPPPLVKYALPPQLSFQGANVGGNIYSADYDQMGMPRVYAPSPTPAPAFPSGSAAPQITVNVQAMDARSFLDRSTEIAQAVRQAMLQLNPINDVVSDL